MKMQQNRTKSSSKRKLALPENSNGNYYKADRETRGKPDYDKNEQISDEIKIIFFNCSDSC